MCTIEMMHDYKYGVATISRLLQIRARGGEAHRAEAAARHQGRSKLRGHKNFGPNFSGFI